MAHTTPTRTSSGGIAREGFLKSLGQISLGDADVTTALAASTHTAWVVVNNADGSLRHVVPTSELTVVP